MESVDSYNGSCSTQWVYGRLGERVARIDSSYSIFQCQLRKRYVTAAEILKEFEDFLLEYNEDDYA
jgi:hypothetical protein